MGIWNWEPHSISVITPTILKSAPGLNSCRLSESERVSDPRSGPLPEAWMGWPDRHRLTRRRQPTHYRFDQKNRICCPCLTNSRIWFSTKRTLPSFGALPLLSSRTKRRSAIQKPTYPFRISAFAMQRVLYSCGCVCTGIGCNSGMYFDWRLLLGKSCNTGTNNCVDNLLDWFRWHVSGRAAFFSCYIPFMRKSHLWITVSVVAQNGPPFGFARVYDQNDW